MTQEQSDKIKVIHGDCLDALKAIPSCSIDSCVTDPPASISFMGKAWDSDKGGRKPWTAWLSEVMSEVSRVLKPGAHALVWSLPRTSHWTGIALEDAGFEIRDVVTHLFGTGFAKGQNIGKGWHTALKPAAEFWWLCRKPMSESTIAGNVLKHGTGALNIDACRIKADWENDASKRGFGYGFNKSGYKTPDNASVVLSPQESTGWQPIQGRYPANVTHDGSSEVLEEFAKYYAPGQLWETGPEYKTQKSTHTHGGHGTANTFLPRNDGTSPARFFYGSKASTEERLGSRHPTVKSVQLMRWLCRLITPKGGTVIDPFAGTGTTGQACLMEGFSAILIEKEAEYIADINRRIAHTLNLAEVRQGKLDL